ncbi:MAG: T9SS type A sorting domain-containing protein [Ferruginibacter sp.]
MNVGGQQTVFKVKIMGNAAACAGPSSLAITLPPGYVFVPGSASRTGGSGTVSQISASANTAILSVGNIPASPDSTVISYRVYAGCAVIGSTATNDVDYSFSSCIGSSTATSNAFNSLNAQLNILNVTNNAFTGIVGNTYSRVITISNDGFGSVDTLYLDDISGNGLSVTGAVVSSGTLVRTKTLNGSDTLYRYKIISPTANGFLNSGEQITVTETVKIVACNNMSTNFDSWYGPGGVKCNGVNNTSTAGASINDALQPNLKVIAGNVPYNSCRGSVTHSTAKFVNTGAVMLRNASINLKQYGYLWEPPQDTYQNGQLAFDPAAFTYKTGQNGTLQTISPDSAKYFTAASCFNTTKPYSVFLTLPNIAAGDTLFLNFDEYLCCPSDCLYGGGLGWPGVEISYSFFNECGSPVRTLSPQVLRYNTSSYGTATEDLPLSMTPGTDYSFNYDITNATASTGNYLPGSFATMVFELPSRVEFGGSLSDLILTTRTGAAYPAPVTFTYNASTRIITARFLITSFAMIDQLNRLQIKINKLRVNCSLPAGSTPAIFRLSLQQAGCSTCTIQYVCLSTPVDTWCPTPCPDGGITVLDVSSRRTNYGLPDNDNNGTADASGSLDFSKIKTDYVFHGDTIEITYRAIAAVGSSGSPFRYGYLDAGFSERASDFTPLRSSVQVYNNGVSIGTCGNLLPVFTGSISRLNFSIDQLCSFPGSYNRFSNNDSFIIKTYYRVTGGLSTWDGFSKLIKLTNEFYISRVANPSAAADKFFCNTVNGKFRYVSVYSAYWVDPELEVSGCNNVFSEVYNYLSVGACCNHYDGGNDFGFEYRPVNMFDTLYYSLPAGYTFINATAQQARTAGTASTAYLTVPLVPENPGQPTLLFDVKKLYSINGGTWPISDEGNYVRVRIFLRPTCTSATTTNAQLEFVQKNAPGFNGSFRHTAGGPVVLTYDKPSLLLTSPSETKTVNTNTVDWEIQLTNTSKTSQASLAWISKNAVSGVTITSVETLSGPGGTVTGSIVPVGTIYRLGTFNSLENRFYKITATYTSCTKDSLSIGYGWNCTGYPTNVLNAVCSDALKLYVIPQPANLQLTILNEPVPGTYQLCSRLDYEVKVINPALGNARQLRVTAQLPASGGVAYIPGSYQLAASTGAYTVMNDANISIAGNTLTITIPNTSISLLPSTDSFKIKLGLQTNSCNFVSGQDIRFTPLGTNPCGSAIVGTTQQSKKIRIAGAPTQSNVYSMGSTIAPVTVCGAGMVTTSYHFKIVNLGPSPTTVLDGFNIEPPAPWRLNTGSIVYTHNPTAAVYTTTVGGIYNFVTGNNLAVGDSIVFNATLYVPAADVPSLLCGTSSPLKENATSTFSAVCQFNGVTCSTQEIVTVHEATTITVNKPSYDIMYFIGALNTTFTHLSGAITLQHTNSVYVPQNVTITAYKDNANGTYDAGDILIGSQTLPVNTDAVQTSTFNIPNQLAGTEYCPIIVVATFDCSCSRAEYPYSCNNVLLPLRFTSQSSKVQACNVLLKWKCETSNTSVEKFIIERSNDAGMNFFEIGSTVSSVTTFNDIHAQAGTNIYRIKAITSGGNIFYSTVMSAEINCGREADRLTVYPNPVNQSSNTNVTFIASAKYANASVYIKDAGGRTVSNKKITLNKGQNKITLETSGMLTGTYFISLYAGKIKLSNTAKLIVN